MTALEKLVYPASYTQEAPDEPAAPLRPILTVAERAALLECEAIIRQGRAVFVQVGHALTRIRESRLYRERYCTFEQYCLEEWEITDRYARNLRSASDVVDLLQEKQFSTLPATESQARPLIKLPREEWAAAWEEVVGTAPNGRVTAGHVTNVVQRRINRLAGIDTEVITKSNTQGPKPKVIDAGTRDERVRASLNQARAALRDLADVIGTADGSAAANVVVSIQNLDELQDHLSRKHEMVAARRATE